MSTFLRVLVGIGGWGMEEQKAEKWESEVVDRVGIVMRDASQQRTER